MPVVYSPHLDDAIFSLGSHIIGRGGAIIACPMAAIPADPVGRMKYETLRAEHINACDEANAFDVNGTFLDDVYPRGPVEPLRAWLASFLRPDTTVYVPVGIHHPDHVLVSDLLCELLRATPPVGRVYFYEELPYRVDYPDKAQERLAHISDTVGQLCWISTKLFDFEKHWPKRRAVACYKSQVDDSVTMRVMQPEHIWQLAR